MTFISMFCPYCGSEIMVPSDKDTCFCTNCGESIVYTPDKKSVPKTSENQYVRNGDKFLELGESSGAFTSYKKAIELDPSCSLAWWGLCKYSLYKDALRSCYWIGVPLKSSGLSSLIHILNLSNEFEQNYQHALTTANESEKNLIQNDISSYLNALIPALNKLDDALENGKLTETSLFSIYQTHKTGRPFNCDRLPSMFKNIEIISSVVNKISTGLKNAEKFCHDYLRIEYSVSYILNSNNTSDVRFYYGKMIFQCPVLDPDETDSKLCSESTLTIVDNADDAIQKIITEFNRRIHNRLCLECGAPLKFFKDVCSKKAYHYNCMPVIRK